MASRAIDPRHQTMTDGLRHMTTADARTLVLESTLTCPECGHQSVETMPTNACVFFHECAGCGALLKPKAGDCCVFCSYGSVPCPPIQQQGSSCCGH